MANLTVGDIQELNTIDYTPMLDSKYLSKEGKKSPYRQ